MAIQDDVVDLYNAVENWKSATEFFETVYGPLVCERAKAIRAEAGVWGMWQVAADGTRTPGFRVHKYVSCDVIGDEHVRFNLTYWGGYGDDGGPYDFQLLLPIDELADIASFKAKTQQMIDKAVEELYARQQRSHDALIESRRRQYLELKAEFEPEVPNDLID